MHPVLHLGLLELMRLAGLQLGAHAVQETLRQGDGRREGNVFGGQAEYMTQNVQRACEILTLKNSLVDAYIILVRVEATSGALYNNETENVRECD